MIENTRINAGEVKFPLLTYTAHGQHARLPVLASGRASPFELPFILKFHKSGPPLDDWPVILPAVAAIPPTEAGSHDDLPQEAPPTIRSRPPRRHTKRAGALVMATALAALAFLIVMFWPGGPATRFAPRTIAAGAGSASQPVDRPVVPRMYEEEPASRGASPTVKAPANAEPAESRSIPARIVDRSLGPVGARVASSTSPSGQIIDPYAGRVAQPLTGDAQQAALEADRRATRERNLQQMRDAAPSAPPQPTDPAVTASDDAPRPSP